jgi:anti-sigma regulatory factor (Ser/Thr protein kinase)
MKMGASVIWEGFETELPRRDQAPGQARRWLAGWLSGTLERDDRDRARLLASELVTNAVLHGQGRIMLCGHVDTDRVLVEVIDEGHGFEREVRQQPFEAARGRGLGIVEAESSRWGIHEGTTHVWFELERPGPRLGPHTKLAH